jgi:hypothetical protein
MDVSKLDPQPPRSHTLEWIADMRCVEFKQHCVVVSADLSGCSSICAKEAAALLARVSRGTSSHGLCAIRQDGRLQYTRRCVVAELRERAALNSDSGGESGQVSGARK